MPYEADAAFVRRLVARDPRAWSEWVRDHALLVDRVVRARLRAAGAPLDEAEAVAQDVVVKLIDDDCARLRSYAAQSSLKTWICIVAAREASHWLDRWGLRRAAALDEEPPVPEANEDGSDAREIREVLPLLPAQARLILTLRYVRGMEYERIGRLMRISSNTVGPRLTQARGIAKDLLLRRRAER